MYNLNFCLLLNLKMFNFLPLECKSKSIHTTKKIKFCREDPWLKLEQVFRVLFSCEELQVAYIINYSVFFSLLIGDQH